MFREKVFQFKNLLAVKEAMSYSGMVYTTNPVPADNEWALNANGEIHVKDAASDKVGAFRSEIHSLLVGDVIEIDCEIYSISGTKPKIAIDGMAGSVPLLNTDGYQYPYNEWKKLSLKYIIQEQYSYYRVNVGTFTADIGEYKIRNVTIRVLTRNKEALIHSNTFVFASGFTEISSTFPSRIRKDESMNATLHINVKRSDGSAFVANTNYTLGNIPEKYKLRSGFVFPIGGTPSDSSSIGVGRGWIYSDSGLIVVKPYVNMNDISFSLAYLAEN